MLEVWKVYGYRAGLPEVIWAIFVGHHYHRNLRVIFDRIDAIRGIGVVFFDMCAKAFQERFTIDLVSFYYSTTFSVGLTQDLVGCFLKRNSERRLFSAPVSTSNPPILLWGMYLCAVVECEAG